MRYDFNDPNYWFDRAEEMRTRNDLMRDDGNREVILRIVHDYERLGSCALGVRKRGANDNRRSVS
jgi:hypothetical protein